MAVVVATAVTADGAREVLGLDVGDSEDEVFWPSFLTGPKKRVGHLPVAHGNGDRNAQDPWKHTTRSSYLQSSTG